MLSLKFTGRAVLTPGHSGFDGLMTLLEETMRLQGLTRKLTKGKRRRMSVSACCRYCHIDEDDKVLPLPTALLLPLRALVKGEAVQSIDNCYKFLGK